RAAGEVRIALAYYLWGLAWWCGNLHAEITGFVHGDARIDALLAATVFTGWLAAEAYRLRPARALVLTSLVALASGVPFAFGQMDAHEHPFGGAGAWAWLAYAVLGVRSLVCLRGGGDRSGDWAQFAWLMTWPLVLSLSATWLCHDKCFGQGLILTLAA